MTEAVPLIFNSQDTVRQGSLGVAITGVQVRIVDFSDCDVPEGETGEIAVLGPGNCIGYWNDPQATGMLLRNGWMHTGDLACRDSDGYYWFQGRGKEIIVRGGSNISPQKAEEACDAIVPRQTLSRRESIIGGRARARGRLAA
jgi:long-chain acyl-CoA synthetase